MSVMEAAIPKYSIDQTVDYVDHHKRVITGKIFHIEASWSRRDRMPFIIYSISHPSYKGQRCYRSEEDIRR